MRMGFVGERTDPAAPGVNHPQRYRALRQQAVAQALSARRYLVLLVPLVAGVLVLNHYRRSLFGTDAPARAAAVVVLVVAGWALARQLGRFLQPKLLSRLESGTA